MTHKGKTLGHFQTDMIFIENQPHLVVEWKANPEGEVPSILIRLDRAYLRPLKGWEGVDYMYEYPVESPISIDLANDPTQGRNRWILCPTVYYPSYLFNQMISFLAILHLLSTLWGGIRLAQDLNRWLWVQTFMNSIVDSPREKV